MRHPARLLPLILIPLMACAHMPADLTGWITDKSLRVGECAAKQLITRGDVKACIGPNFIRDLGTEACEQAHSLLASKPTEAPKGRGDQ